MSEPQVTLPTVGRIMYLYYTANLQSESPSNPHAFIVSHVNAEGTEVNGCMFDKYGDPINYQGIEVIQPNQSTHHLLPGTAFVMWMPYQVKAHAAAQEVTSPEST